MNKHSFEPRHQGRTWLRCFAALCAGLFIQGQALALDVTVEDASGASLTVPFRWLLEEDNTVQRPPGTPVNDSISLVIHQSHAPVAGTNTSAVNPATVVIPDSSKAYYLSVMAEGYSLGGARVAPGQTNITVILNQHKIPTSQISIFVFEDHNSINNAPDATEPGLGGFRVIISDPLGGGPISQDAFGNPLGTTYEFNPTSGEPVFETDGTPKVLILGNGSIYTDSFGRALVKYIPAGKIGVTVIPPTGTDWRGGHGTAKLGSRWNQTATIEGTLTVDAWVKANEASVWVGGFGVGFYHVFFGFVDPTKLQWAANPPPANANNVTVTGQLRYNHFGRPPTNQMFVAGPTVPEGWVGLNQFTLLPGGGIGPQGAVGPGLYAVTCDDKGNFTIPNVAPGTYQLVTWDKPLDSVFGFNTLTVVAGTGTTNLGNVLCYRWFGTLEGSIFYDADKDGFRDAGEPGIPLMAVNLRFRDGRMYMGTVTDGAGDYEMAEVFPFFKWLVAEVDFGRYKDTGLTKVTDEGGPIPSLVWPAEGKRNPQPQFELLVNGVADINKPIINLNTSDNLSRTIKAELPGDTLLQATLLFLNQNNRIDWGKADYAPGDNGGISGIVYYSTTRAEEDPREAVGDPWEPGIPRVQVALYQDANEDKVIDDLNADGVTLADVDNYPLGDFPGPGDVDRNGNRVFNPGDALQVVWTDSWDEEIAANPTLGAMQANPPIVNGKPIVGADSYGTWNQTCDGVFDGGYAINSYFPGGMASGSTKTNPLPAGMYIVQASTPPGYLIQTEESMNVAFGDVFQPSKLWLPPELVGDLHLVPDELTLFPGEQAPFKGQMRPLADRKWVMVSDGNNAACDFHMFTEVPKAARVVGFVLNDLTAEFNAFSPNFGEKGSPGWLPISFRDWSGHEVARTYCDEYGTYNALMPVTYTINAPWPSGVQPNMLTIILNDPTMPDPADPTGKNRIPDPKHNPNYSVSPTTWMFWPGSVSYLDTPIVPLAGFTGTPNNQLDTEPPAGTPVIANSYTAAGAGPYLAANTDVLAIESLGDTQVPNPAYQVGSTELTTIKRDYGFGAAQGTGNVTLNGTPMEIVSWANNIITAKLSPAQIAIAVPGNTWQLMVTRDNAKTSPIGLTLTYGLTGNGTRVIRVAPRLPTQTDPLPDPIQEAIDLAREGDLILIGKGVYYENPILYKAARLQGSGYRTIINANPVPTERANNWIVRVTKIMGGNPFGANGMSGILVLGNPDWEKQPGDRRARIDGVQIVGSITGGGILAYNETRYLRISNNRIVGNQGTSAGGIQVGMQDNVGTVYNNRQVTIEYNQIFKNGGVNGPGGIGIFNGAENYTIQYNYIIGNFSRVNGGGIGHEGVCKGGLIAANVIVNNEVFYGAAVGGDGGGIYIGGEVAAGGTLSSGSGSVTIINNLIQGNLAGSGRGGGICAAGINGLDAQARPGVQGQWYRLDIINNVIVNNAAGYHAGGIAIRDATRVRIIHNTIANNDCTATAKAAFPAGQTNSTPQAAGLVTYQHSALLAQYSREQFCNPELVNNIILSNRSFFWNGASQTLVPAPAVAGLHPIAPFRDLQVVTLQGAPSPLRLNPRFCLLTSRTGYHTSNPLPGNPWFIDSYTNHLFSAIVADEAGNNISIRFTPAGWYKPDGTVQGNYHIQTGSAALNVATANSPAAFDYDLRLRPQDVAADIGADELGDLAAVSTAWPNPLLIGPGAVGLPAGTPTIPPPATPVLPAMQPVPPDADGIDTDGDGIVNNDHKYIRLSAGDGFARMADGNELYTFGFSDQTATPHQDAMMQGILKAQSCAPTLVVKEGQKVYLDLLNVGMLMRPDLFDSHSVHFHGFPQAAVIFDGEPMGSLSINMGGTFRYFYNIVEPGTYLYHCHVEATEHMEMGMIGNIWIEPKQNYAVTDAYPGHTRGVTKFAYNDGDGSTLYHVDAPLQLAAFDRNFHEQHIAVQGLPFWSLDESYPMINGRGYPDTVNPAPLPAPPTLAAADPAWPSSQPVTSLVTAKQGQKVLLRVSNVSLSDFHTLSVLGIPMRVVGKDARLLRGPTGKSLAYMTTSITLGGGETADVILDTAGVTPGRYVIYDARLNHLANDQEDYGGMMTELIVTP